MSNVRCWEMKGRVLLHSGSLGYLLHNAFYIYCHSTRVVIDVFLHIILCAVSPYGSSSGAQHAVPS